VPRSALRRIHLIASLLALGVVASFLAATVSVELVGGEEDVRTVKHWIVRALFVLVPVMAAAGISGRRLAGASRAPLVRRKLRRMQLVGATGLLVLVPCAITLDRLAADGDLGLAFGLVQTVELLGGSLNLTLLSLNFRDGMALRAKRAPGRACPARRAA
jgi:hypothetical protein